MPETSRGYPYPSPTDPNDVPSDMHDLAEAIDADVQGHVSGGDPHPVYESGSEATARMNAHITAGHPTVPSHDAGRHRFVGVKAVANSQATYIAPLSDQLNPMIGEEFDTDGAHSPGTSILLTLPFTGYWRISYGARAIGGGAAVLKNFRLVKNGTVVIRSLPDDDAYWVDPGGQMVMPPEVFHFSAGDTVWMWFDVTGSSGQSITLAANANCYLAAEYLGV